ncbi:AMP-binding protein, partial [Nocardia paucivorans]|uniref:AMP-binding protein n=1 Tax=Nocardia paucivorans TaxID=114259 RepID=UPI0005924745
MLLSALPDRRAATAPHASAVADDSIDLDNSQFLAAVRRAAASLRMVGVSPGDVVAVILPDTATLVVSMFAAWRLGAAVTLVDPSTDTGSRQYEVDAKVLITAQPSTTTPPTQLVISAHDLTAAEPDTDGPRPSGGAPVLVTRTDSGRDILLGAVHLDALSRFLVEVFALTDTDRNLVAMSSARVNGIVVGVLSPLLAGGSVTLAGAIGSTTIFDRIRRSRATWFSAEPDTYAELAALPDHTRPEVPSLRFAVCCDARIDTELRSMFEHRYGIPIINGYGLKEVYERAHAAFSPASATRVP